MALSAYTLIVTLKNRLEGVGAGAEDELSQTRSAGARSALDPPLFVEILGELNDSRLRIATD